MQISLFDLMSGANTLSFPVSLCVCATDERSPGASWLGRTAMWWLLWAQCSALLLRPPASPASRGITSASLSHLKTPNCTAAGQ